MNKIIRVDRLEEENANLRQQAQYYLDMLLQRGRQLDRYEEEITELKRIIAVQRAQIVHLELLSNQQIIDLTDDTDEEDFDEL